MKLPGFTGSSLPDLFHRGHRDCFPVPDPDHDAVLRLRGINQPAKKDGRSGNMDEIQTGNLLFRGFGTANRKK